MYKIERTHFRTEDESIVVKLCMLNFVQSCSWMAEIISPRFYFEKKGMDVIGQLIWSEKQNLM